MPLHMPRRGLIVTLAAAAAWPLAAHAQSFPDHAIKVVVPYPAGGPTDTIARTVTRGLSADLGQSVVVENQAGAGGRIGTRAVARATPDGYTLLLGGSNTNAITPALYKGLDFEPMKDFAPVASLATESLVLVVHPAVPARTLDDLVRYGKENPAGSRQGRPWASLRTSSSSSFAHAPEQISCSFRIRGRLLPLPTCWAARSRCM